MNDRPDPAEVRTSQIFSDQQVSNHRRTSRMFAWLMLAQWIGAVVAALAISPHTWIGEQQRVHQHVWIALVLGAALASLPIGLALRLPTWRLTRHVIAAAQVLFSALLIHLTGGRVETHFHVFGSLAFLAFYRDWSVLLTATVVVAVDHMVRGIYIPLSVFGTAVSDSWRWLEHAGWVLFEDVILVLSCVRGLREMRGIAERQARLEMAKSLTEQEVADRTQQLLAVNRSLEENQLALRDSNEQLRAAAAERESLHGKLLVASREAGMAEVAIGVLHNVGNVLNSVNVAASVAAQKLRESEVPNLVRAGALLKEHSRDLPEFLQADERGRHLPTFLIEVAQCLDHEHKAMTQELERVMRGVDHVKHVISLQQAHAKRPSLIEAIRPDDLMEAALQMHQDSSPQRDIDVIRRFETTAPVRLDKHRVLQVLVNLISNAKRAIRSSSTGSGQLILVITEQLEGAERHIRFEVRDTGIGIPVGNLSRIFSHGFTTREDGHGFGLHTAATAAQAMGGSLTAFSDGPGKGASFVLSLPTVEERAPAPIQKSICAGSK